MDASFWEDRWTNNRLGWHYDEPNPLLIDNFKHLEMPENSRVFVPLCGKTIDIHWLLANGYRVVGAELSKTAIEQLFDDLSLTPTITQLDTLVHYCAQSIDIYAGNIFELSHEILGPVDAIYDRAALVALPEPMRMHYTKHLICITNTAPQLLIKFTYDQSVMPGPPFSIKDDKLAEYYDSSYTLNLLSSIDVEGGLKGKCEAQESVWTLTPKP